MPAAFRSHHQCLSLQEPVAAKACALQNNARMPSAQYLCAGSACATPPLLLAGTAPLLRAPAALQCVPHLLAEAIAWWAVTKLAHHSAQRSQPRAAQAFAAKQSNDMPPSSHAGIAPGTILKLAAWNPLMVATTASKSTAAFSHAAVTCALLAGMRHSVILCAASCAIAAYIRPHNLLFAVPLCLLLMHGPEHLAAQPDKAARGAAATPRPVDCKPKKTVENSLQRLLHPDSRPGRQHAPAWRTGLQFAVALLLCAAVLAAMSDLALVGLHCRSGKQCTHGFTCCFRGEAPAHTLAAWVQRLMHQSSGSPSTAPWPWEVYAGVWQYSDLRVNIGLWWCATTATAWHALFRNVMPMRTLCINAGCRRSRCRAHPH